MQIAIIGGSGRLGLWYASRFRAAEHEVTITGRNQAKLERAADAAGVSCTTDNDVAMHAAELIILSTPIASTPAAIRDAARVAQSGALVCDLASVKSSVLKAYRTIERQDLELASLHPLHGPRITSLKGVTILATFLRDGPMTQRLRALLRTEGAQLTEIDGEKHDKDMAILQGLTHFVAIAFARTLAEHERPSFETPAYALMRAAAARVVLQDPALYAAIQLENPESANVRQAFLRASEQLARIAEQSDLQALQREIETGARFFHEPDAELVATDACVGALIRHRAGTR